MCNKQINLNLEMKGTKKAIALGTFDGLHKGHRAVLKNAEDCFLTVLTFYLPPKSVIKNDSNLLMLPDDKEKALKTLGADQTVFLDFNKIRDTSPEDFSDYVYKTYNPDLVVCGFDFRFGKNARGDLNFLQNYCNEKGIEFKWAPPVTENDIPVSSTDIRNLVLTGNVLDANRLMFIPFGFSSEVLHGDKRGRTIGFPTINQRFPDLLCKPKFGVYKSETEIKGKKYQSITNVGIRPTFKTKDVFCETFVLGLDREIYGETVRLNLIEFIREEKKFNSLKELKTAINNDMLYLRSESDE